MKELYDKRPQHEREAIDEHLRESHVLAIPTSRGQEEMYRIALEPLVEQGKISGFTISRYSAEAWEKLFDPQIQGGLVMIIHKTSDGTNRPEFERREAIIAIAEQAKGVYPIVIDACAKRYFNAMGGKTYTIENGVPHLAPTNETMIPCPRHMHGILSLPSAFLLPPESFDAA